MTADTMQALVLTEATGPAGARIAPVPRPEPGAGEVLVALEAAALNHRELWISRGQYPGMTLPCTLGADGAGTVAAVGDGVDPAMIGRPVVLYPGRDWGPGRRFPSPRFALLGMPLPGTVAEAICVPADLVAARPAHLGAEQADALPTAGVTAWRGLTRKAGLTSGERILITGISGGVATLAFLFAKAMGARVFVTSGSDATLETARALGAEAGFDYREAGWRKALQQASGGLDVVFDGAPASGLAEYGRALRLGARVVVYGSTGGVTMTMSAPDLFLRHATIFGTAMGAPEDFAAMLAFVAEHRLEPLIDRSFRFAEAAEALRHLETGHGFGKVTIRMDRAGPIAR